MLLKITISFNKYLFQLISPTRALSQTHPNYKNIMILSSKIGSCLSVSKQEELCQFLDEHASIYSPLFLVIFCFCFLFFRDFIYLFMRDTQRHRQRKKQAPRGKPDGGLNPRTLESRSEPKADAQPTEPPRCPKNFIS